MSGAIPSLTQDVMVWRLSDLKRPFFTFLVACAIEMVEAGVWCYKPYEYEAWMLQKMTEEVGRGVLHVGWPGKYLTLEKEPEAFYSEKPVEGYEAIRGDPGVPPHKCPYPETVIEAVKKGDVYDLGRLDVGYVQIQPEWGLGNRPGLYVGESVQEALNTDAEHFEQSLLLRPDGENGWRSDIPLMARYIRLTGPKILSVKFRSQVDWREPVGRFACGDARKEKIWRTGVETLRRCRRTFLLDGVKRDRLPWAADMAVEILAEAYTFGDAEIVKRSISAVGSGDMTQGTVNGIGPYSLWWIIDHDLLQRYFDEPAYLKLHYPKIKARMAEISTHEDERGFYVRDLGWDFLDWTDDKCGNVDSVISRQVLYFGALRAAVRLAERMHDSASAVAWKAKADALRQKILVVGMDRTRHARIFAILFGLVDGTEAKRMADELATGDLPQTMTPFMASLEVMALLESGHVVPALKKFESVWGEMVDFGVDCYWEGWNRQAKGNDVYVFYERRFGKSLCHGWSSGPAFLIPGWFYGIRPTADGWRTHEVKPAFAEFAPNAQVSVPVPSGRIDVSFVNGRSEVRPAVTSADADKWPLETLYKTPRVFPADEYKTNGVEVAFLEGLPYNGKPTRIFCYYGVPKHKAGEKIPGMVLVHGGGGSAFYRWVKFWNDRGYAAISMDTCGCVSGNTVGSEQRRHFRHMDGGPAGWGGFGETGKDVRDQWLYHAVADAIIGHSFLRSLNGVDANRIGVTGVSWGGVISSIVSGVDGRFKFAAPVYGCGAFLENSPMWANTVKQMGVAKTAEWTMTWDPIHYLARAKIPVHWLAGTNDRAFSLPALMDSYAAVPTKKSLSVKVRLGHTHGTLSEEAIELTTWADYYLRGVPLPEPVAAELNFTKDSASAWIDRNWETVPAKLVNGKPVADIPEGTTAYYFNTRAKNGFVDSTPVMEMQR